MAGAVESVAAGPGSGPDDFEAFVRREIDGLARYAGVLTGNPQDAHDVLVDALLTARARWADIATMTHPLAYLRRIVLTTFLAEARKTARRRTDPVPQQTLDRPVDDDTSSVLERLDLDAAIQRLPERQRAALVARYYLDLTVADIADQLGCPESTVRTLISRGLASLRVQPDLGTEQP